MDTASKSASFDGKQQLCDGLRRVRTGTSRAGALPSGSGESSRLASVASESSIWILDGGLHEQGVRNRLHAGAIHAGCGHELCRYGFAGMTWRTPAGALQVKA